MKQTKLEAGMRVQWPIDGVCGTVLSVASPHKVKVGWDDGRTTEIMASEVRRLEGNLSHVDRLFALLEEMTGKKSLPADVRIELIEGGPSRIFFQEGDVQEVWRTTPKNNFQHVTRI